MSKLAPVFVAVLLLCIVAVGAPLRIPDNILPYHSPDFKSWIRPYVANSQDTLVYVDVITSLTTGGTQIYDISNSSATLVGELNYGGGGALAVDSQQNVYVVQANYDQNFNPQDSHVYVFARGATQPFFDFDAPGFGAWAMTVGADGTVYMAGQLYPDTTTAAVMKFAPGNSIGQLLPSDKNQPQDPKGIAVDSAGNLFVGWQYGPEGPPRLDPVTPCYFGCIESIAASQQGPGGHWRTRVPELEASGLEAGPFAMANSSLMYWASNLGRYNYIITVPAKSQHPTQVAQLSPAMFPSDPWRAALNGDGTEIWGAMIGFLAGPGSSVYQIDYPSGNVSMSFPLVDPQPFYFAVSLAVSPTYYPPH